MSSIRSPRTTSSSIAAAQHPAPDMITAGHFGWALKNLYEVEAEEPYTLTLLGYKAFGKPLPPLTGKSRAAQNHALNALQHINHITACNPRSLLKAHELLVQGCYDHDVTLVQQAFEKLRLLELTELQISAFLEVRVYGDFEWYGFLGYAAKHNDVDIMAILFAEGANPNSKPSPSYTIGTHISGYGLKPHPIVTYNYDDKPIFFSVVTHATTWIESQTIQQKSISPELVSVADSLSKIELFLRQGFDINATYQQQNVLQHAYHADFSGDMKYHVHLLAWKIAKLVEEKIIAQDPFERFAETLNQSGLLKLFPVLAVQYEKTSRPVTPPDDEKKEEPAGGKRAVYNTTDNNHERNYYYLKSLVFNLIGLCAYELFRLHTGVTALITSSPKVVELDEHLSILKKIQSNHFQEHKPDKDYNGIADLINQTKDKLKIIFSKQRLGFFKQIANIVSKKQDDKPTAASDWDQFCSMNTLEMAVLYTTAKMGAVKNKVLQHKPFQY